MSLKNSLALTLAMSFASLAHAAPALELNAVKTGAPIQPYIYGQFIEHLGRCIYGGIWAEMLEDRKFYFPVADLYAPYTSLRDTPFPVVGASPWQIIGAPGSVTMVREGAFVGDHTPVLRGGSGVRQNDLGVVSGKSYTGYVWLKSAGTTEAPVEVRLVWGPGENESASLAVTAKPGTFAKHAFTFKAGVTTSHAHFEVRALKADVALGTASLMPADNVRGLRRDTLALLKELNGTIYRWPGGNFTSGYDWHDGIGDRDRRPPRKNPAWTGVEQNDFGTDEFIDFCRELKTEPMIAANTGFGDAYSAAQWVEYCNSPSTSLAGSWRAQNGNPQPYAVKNWCVGNEMFGTWQLGFMQLAHYTIKHNMVAAAMLKVDPTLVLAAVGDIEKINPDHDPDQAKSGNVWSKGMLLDCADSMSLISEHFYSGRTPWTKDERAPLAAHVVQLKDQIRNKANAHRSLQASLPNLKGRVVPITMDEWNYWHREYVYGELGCTYDMADALGVAEGLHEYYRQSDLIHMAFYAQTVNVIGAIKTTKTEAEMETTGLVLQLYRAHFGTTPLVLAGDFGKLDVAAALTADKKAVTIAVVNPSEEPARLPLALGALTPSGTATRYTISADDERTQNAPGKARAVSIISADYPLQSGVLEVPKLGIALFVIPLQSH